MGLRQGEYTGDAGERKGSREGGPEGTDPALGCSPPNKPPKCTALFSRSSSNHYIQTQQKVTIKQRGCILVNLTQTTLYKEITFA